MLKKRNIFKTLFSFLACCALVLCGFAFNQNNEKQSAYATDGTTPPSYGMVGFTPVSGDNWEADFDTNTLTLKGGVTWTSTFDISQSSRDFTIQLAGSDNVISTVDSYAINFQGERKLTIAGTGSLVLKTTDSETEGFSAIGPSGVKVDWDDTKITAYDSDEADAKVIEKNTFNAANYKTIKFVSNTPAIEIAATDQEINYNGTKTFDISTLGLFDLGDTEGTLEYSIVEKDDSTATGSIEGNSLTLNKCGVMYIKATIAGDSVSQAEAKLTINRASLVEGYEPLNTHIFVGYKNGDEKEDKTYLIDSDKKLFWFEVNNNLGGGEVTLSFWKDAACSEKTTIDDGAETDHGMPTLMGSYYVKAEIAESDFYNGITIIKNFKIKTPLDFDKFTLVHSITYKDLVKAEDSGLYKYDLTKAYTIPEEYANYIQNVKFDLFVDNESIPLPNGMLVIEGVTNEEGDLYYYDIKFSTKEDCLYVGIESKTFVRIIKPTIALEDMVFESKEYDEAPCDYEINNPFDGVVTVNYFTDEECANVVVENGGVPVSIGKYYAKVHVEETEFTKETERIVEFNIFAHEVEIIWDNRTFVYNGEVQEIEAYYLDKLGNPVALGVSTDVEFKKAQSYVATAQFKNGETIYRLPENATKEYTISPLEVTVEINDKFVFYGKTKYDLTVKVVSDNKFVADDKPYELSVSTEITTTTPVGVYDITGRGVDSNYKITFAKNGLFYVKNKIVGNFNGTTQMIQGWVWNVPENETNEPSAVDMAGKTIEYTYYSINHMNLEAGDSLDRYKLDAKPTNIPGEYTILATIKEGGIYEASLYEVFLIDKIELELPEEDTTVYTYNEQTQVYKLVSNSEYYTISKREFREAGTHTIYLTIKDEYFEKYRWPNGNKVYEFEFVIHKKGVAKPLADNRNFKYNGSEQTYAINSTDEYTVYFNKQTQVGKYNVEVRLNDNLNYAWSDGSTDNLIYEFVINQDSIENPTVTDTKGNLIDSKDVIITEVSGIKGLDPEVKLEVVVTAAKDEGIADVRAILEEYLKKYDKIFKVTDVKLVKNGEAVQPENNIMLKMLVPKELLNANFTLYHIHIDESGNKVVSEVDYGGIDENGYITFQTNKLSAFAFVYEQDSLVSTIVIFAVLSGLMFVLLIVQLVMFLKKRKSNLAKIASAVPVFFVGSELVSSIVLGSVFGILLVANIVLLVFNLKLYKTNKGHSKNTKEKLKMAKSKSK